MVVQKYLWDGDPKLTIGDDGADLTFNGGQPVMDQGWENAVMISLFTEPDWIGNALASSDSERIGAQYLQRCREPVTLQSLTDCANAARAALNWMLSTGVASAVEAVTKNPTGRIRETEVTITPPGGYPYKLTIAQGGPNWLKQKNDPAYRRVE